MTVAAQPAPSPIRFNARRAAANWRGVLNPVKHHEAFLELIFAMGGGGFQRSYESFRADPDGQRLLAERPDVVTALTDTDRLAALTPGTLGHAYHDFMAQNRLDAGLYDDTYHDLPAIGARLGWDDDFLYVIRRGIALHDILHVLGGYGPDVGGEFGVLGFTHGQVGGRMTGGSAAMLMTLPLGVPRRDRLRWWRESVARGKGACVLFAAPYEEMLAQPLDDVRAALGITPDVDAHPHGHLYSAYQFGGSDDRAMDTAYEPYAYRPGGSDHERDAP
ncbi:MAG: Coq4 family protein [Actinomycetota bacterium]